MKQSLDKTLISYNKTAEDYFKNIAEFDTLPEIETFCSLIKPTGHILDLGCGPGHHAKIFTENGFKVTGIDFSTEMIKLARQNTPKAQFRVMDIRKLKFPKDSFDSIWASASLIHLEKSILPTVILKLNHILARNGIFYLSLKEGLGEEETVDKRYGGVIKFHAFYKVKEVENYLIKAGFILIDIYKREKRPIYDTNAWIHAFVKKP